MLARSRARRRDRAVSGASLVLSAPAPVPAPHRARRRAAAWLLVLHGLMHASVGVWAADLGPAWYVTPLWWMAMTGFVGAGCGLLGLAGLRPRWQPLVVAATLASVALFATHGVPAVAVGSVMNVVALVAALRWGEHGAAGRRHRSPALRALGHAAGIGFLVYASAVVLLRPWHTRWGATDDERTMRLLGDDLVPEAHYRMDHVVTVRAPADSVWPWLAQIGQDRAGFYSYDWLERLIGDDIHNADRIHPEWQRLAVGDLVRAAQPDYLGGRLGRDLGWRVAALEPGRGFVLERWGAFVVRPVGERTTRLHVRLRGEGRPTVLGTLLGPLNLFVFEPAHFVMERGMLLGIKRRAEGEPARRREVLAMRRRVEIGLVVVSGGALVLLVVLGRAAFVWRRGTALDVARLAAGRGASAAAPPVSPAELAALPAPAARFFALALAPGQQLVRGAVIRHEGEFRMTPRGRWLPFTSTQRFTARPPGFVWDARIRLAPLLGIRVRDSYLSGEGAILGKVAALVPVVDRRGTRDLATGSLARYLGEAFWLPTALLPCAGVTWEAIDDSTARATLRDGGTAVSLDAHFLASGAVARLTGTRMRDVDGRGVPTPTEFHFWDYRRVAGMTIPFSGEAAWILPEGRFAFWRGTIATVEYEFVDGERS